jgi:hypothetical protein
MLAPFPAEELEAYPVSTIVNSPKNDSAECVRPARDLPRDGTKPEGEDAEQHAAVVYHRHDGV